MEQTIKELTLLLLYLTSWKEMEIPELGALTRSWKGYPFDILNELTEEDYISGSKKSKSVYLTKEGIKKAKEIAKKYQFEDDEF